MSGMFLYLLLCTTGPHCPVGKPIYSDEAFFSEASCRETAIKIARAMHYKDGSDWGWKCFPADYEPKEIK